MAVIPGFDEPSFIGTGDRRLQTKGETMNTKQLLSIFTVILVANLHAEQAPLIPLENFFDSSAIANVQLSPNGEYISYVKFWNERQNLFIRSIDDSSEKRITSDARENIREYYWVNDETLIYLQDQDGNENQQAHLVGREGNTDRNVTPFDGVKTTFISKLKGEPDHILIRMNKRNPELFDLYKLNLKTYRITPYMRNSGDTLAWDLDHNDIVRMIHKGNGIDRRLMYRENEDAPFRQLAEYNMIESRIKPLQFTADNKRFYALSNRNRDKLALVIFDPETGTESEALFEHSDVDTSNISLSKTDKRPLSIQYVSDRVREHYLDPSHRNLIQSLSSRFPEQEIILRNSDEKENHFIVASYSDRSPGSFYRYQSTNDRLVHIGDAMPTLDPNQLQAMEPIQYEARDGLTIHGYLTLPYNNDDGEPFPLIVLVHGGPVDRDIWGPNAIVQFLANRGYAVLQPNYRVSSGYGKAFHKAGFKQSGKAIQDDITDGVNDMINRGIADPDRVAIMGGSYGGYATLAGLAFTPDLYACGVDIVGPSNWFTTLESAPAYWKPGIEFLYSIIGAPKADQELLKETSPLFHVDKMKAPLFVIQGARDPRVPQREADQIVQALRADGKQVAYMLKSNEGHGFRKKENALEMYRAIEQFLALHLGGRKEEKPDMLPLLYNFQ